jgi:hypothetical protein
MWPRDLAFCSLKSIPSFSAACILSFPANNGSAHARQKKVNDLHESSIMVVRGERYRHVLTADGYLDLMCCANSKGPVLLYVERSIGVHGGAACFLLLPLSTEILWRVSMFLATVICSSSCPACAALPPFLNCFTNKTCHVIG